MTRRKNLIILVTISAMLLAGCGSSAADELGATKVTLPAYEKIEHSYEEASVGNLTPEFKLTLTASDFKKVQYRALHDDMEIESVNFSIGDTVEEGEVIISFKSDEIKNSIEGYQNQISEENLLIDHLTRLMEIDKESDYTDDINSLRDSIAVNQQYISELQAKLDSYSIKAEAKGSVFLLNPILSNGTVDHSTELVTMVYGNQEFTAITTEDFEYEIGGIYEATYGGATYDMKLLSKESYEADEAGVAQYILTFAPAEGTDIGYRDKMEITVQRNTLTNVISVPDNAVIRVGDKAYVYILDEDGFCEGIEVTTGDSVGGRCVITSGVEEGMKVVIDL